MREQRKVWAIGAGAALGLSATAVIAQQVTQRFILRPNDVDVKTAAVRQAPHPHHQQECAL